ncbi:MAG: hypothetical protein GWM98_00345, partial [Nitrospinaceae bacterium]|nr:hypothetical protein [Nitrospinaceae bacterium]NIR53252.1 hypothetical protein [Nitrospinaceae bacterium]NIS83650.1 hypothetical protein [Nitrospinaceae bacterium]NIT80439.1 hypothetical protein [Nitrospinaceae bacterium]NIU42777.1 hypothetical protein [Nitrospinaceae bacterium]
RWIGGAAAVFMVSTLMIREFYSPLTGHILFAVFLLWVAGLWVRLPGEQKHRIREHFKKPERTLWRSFLKYSELALLAWVCGFLIYRFYFPYIIDGLVVR